MEKTPDATIDVNNAARSRRYVRQELFKPIGHDGQAALAQTHVAIIGCGALGGAAADSLARAGIGRLTVIDRDYVELHNLQRQMLFDEADVASRSPKAVAAAERLRRINSDIEITPIIADINSGNIAELTDTADLLLDGTDNFETRYLINDLAVKSGRPWVYGGVIAGGGVTMTIRPGISPCLRCVFPDAPEPGSAPTCDTAGVLGPAVHVIASIEATEIMKLAVGAHDVVNPGLLSIDLWSLAFQSVKVGHRDPACPCCGQRNFAFLSRPVVADETVLCGHDAIQVRPQTNVAVDLEALADRLRRVGDVKANRYLVRFSEPGSSREFTVFPDGRAIVKGTDDPREARTIYARYIGV